MNETSSAIVTNGERRRWWLAFWHAGAWTPTGLIRRAALVSFAFVLARAIGLQQFATVLNGTTGSVALGWQLSGFLGVLFVCLYLGAVLLAPVLLIASAFLALWQRFLQPRFSRA